ncbi:MAG: hypothetical protein JWO51_2425 [Rhodospirillales bacterium]|nr:hypothetical protein [Rhodospirillales bacterium]
MTDSSPQGTNPAAVLSFPAGGDGLVETGAIARILASPRTDEFVRRWLAGTVGRDPVLAYHEAVTLAGVLELLTCQEAQAWLLPAMTAALQQDPATGFAAALDIAAALKPAAMARRGMPDMDICLPEPANSRGPSPDRR